MRQGFTIPGGLADVRFRIKLTPVGMFPTPCDKFCTASEWEPL